MRIFDFEPADYTQQYADQDWIHVKDGIAPEFLDYLRGCVASHLAEAKLGSFAIPGPKEQALFEFPDNADFPDEIFDVAAAVCGLRREAMALSERHLQICDEDANPDPTARKDCYPSQVSIGFPIDIPEQSRLVLYPYEHRETNPFISAAALQRHLRPDEQPDVMLRDARPVELADRPGDIVMFAGSNTWHKRRNPASAVNLYVKVNDFDCDPLGEDSSPHLPCDQTVELVEQVDPGVYDSDQIGTRSVQLKLINGATGARSLGDLVEDLVLTNSRMQDQYTEDALTLLRQGILDLT